MPLKYLSKFWRTLEVSLINCEISLILTCSKNCVISFATGATEFAIIDIKLYVRVETLATESDIKLLKQLESGFERTQDIIFQK